jgi:hypothetical protein
MLRKSLPVLSLALGLGVTAGLPAATTPVYKLLYSAPNPSSQGAAPVTVFEVAPGLLYFLSTAQAESPGGGASFGPSIFSLTETGSPPTLIYSFPFNNLSQALVQAANGRLYGEVYDSSRDGLYYSLAASGEGLQQYQTGKWSSIVSMTAAPGEIYDAMATGTASQSFILVRIDETGSETTLHQFSAGEGCPTAEMKLVLGADGNIYGFGGQSDQLNPPFFIYRLTPSGEYSRLLSFQGSYGVAHGVSLIAASDGNLYGTFSGSGANNTGFIFQATLSGQWQTVANFPVQGSAEGMSEPGSLVEASDHALYGATVHNAIFRYDLATHALTLAYQMNINNLQGSCAPCNFIQGMDGKLYGTATIGGPGGGTVFSLDFGLPKPKPSIAQMVPASGSVGQKILLWGSHLLGASSVTFNGVPAASVQVGSTQALTVTIPAGATTGPVAVTTANGSFTTTQSFTVQ